MQSGFDKLPALAGNGSKLVQINSGGTAMAAIALTVGALLFGGAAGVLGQDGTNLFWDNTAKRLGIGNAAPTVALDVTGAGKFSTGLTVGTTLTASTSVVTPLVSAALGVNLGFGINGVSKWVIEGVGASFAILPNADNTFSIGLPTNRVASLFTPIIDSGTAGSLSLRTGNGITQATISHTPLADSPFTIAGGRVGVQNTIISAGGGSGIGLSLINNAASFSFYTGSAGLVETIKQFQVDHTASAASNARITGAAAAGTVGATLSTSDGRSLAITPAVVLGSTLTGPSNMLSPITNSLGADVLLNNTANYFDGPSVAQGTAGTWFVSGTVVVTDTGSGGLQFNVKLWDGTTVIDSKTVIVSTVNLGSPVSLSGYITSPVGNLRVSVRDPSTTNGKILFNQSGNSKDSTITAIRIA